MAPEVFNSRGRSLRPSADLFSFGRLMFFVATGLRPLAGMKSVQIRNSLSTCEALQMPWQGTSDFELACRPLAEACLRVQASHRPDIKEAHNIIEGWVGATQLESGELKLLAARRGKKRAWHEGLKELSLKEHAAKDIRCAGGEPGGAGG